MLTCFIISYDIVVLRVIDRRYAYTYPVPVRSNTLSYVADTGYSATNKIVLYFYCSFYFSDIEIDDSMHLYG